MRATSGNRVYLASCLGNLGEVPSTISFIRKTFYEIVQQEEK